MSVSRDISLCDGPKKNNKFTYLLTYLGYVWSGWIEF